MDNIYKNAKETAAYIENRIQGAANIAIILGSGLGPLADEINDVIEIDYKDIPNFPDTTVKGHEGKLIYGFLGGKRVIAMKGRFHYYEGNDVSQVAFPIRVFSALGIKSLIVTNASGGINRAFNAGDLMIIRDHISFFAPSPLRGKNVDEFGFRFPDMSKAYDPGLIEVCKKVADRIRVPVREGIYAFAQGPMYETPAEIRALAGLGADAVGMSTVPEVIIARHSGMNVLGVSCITNMAAGILDGILNHEDVMETAKESEKNFTFLIKETVSKMEG
ncbi:MAG: purine-nucleoside phosphorylase [Clostridium sp.]|nr:purine-nucleoside phosphorylase [Clostridium sp.]